MVSAIFAAERPEHIIGVIKTVGPQNLTIEMRNNSTATVLITPKTKAVRSNAKANLNELKVGDRVGIQVTTIKGGGLKASEIAWGPRPGSPVPNVQFSLTSSPQQIASLRMHIAVDPHRGAGLVVDPPEIRQITPPEGYVFVLVNVNVSALPAHTVMTQGADFYLIDGGGEKNNGLCRFGPVNWVDGCGKEYNYPRIETTATGMPAPETTYDVPADEFLYSVKKDRVVGSVFHFLDFEFKVSDLPPAPAAQ
jgi:hypothetical protein